MKKYLILPILSASLLLIGCGNSANNNDDNSTSTTRFTTTVVMGDTLRVDNIKKLEWIGSAGNNACSPHSAATTEMADIASGKAHCEALTFAGKNDWRMATAKEHQEFITGMKDAKLTPFYANPACPRLIGTDGTSATAVNTHNSTPVGEMIPWATLLMQSATNFGVKCVRDQ